MTRPLSSASAAPGSLVIRDDESSGPASVSGELVGDIERRRSRFHQLDPWKAEHFRKLAGSQSVKSIFVSHAFGGTLEPRRPELLYTERIFHSCAGLHSEAGWQ